MTETTQTPRDEAPLGLAQGSMNVCKVVGILNVTSDSFSDGGRYLDRARAVEHGVAMVAAGASIVDVGGESTRPGAARIGMEEEIRRVVPVVCDLVANGVSTSVDTTRVEVARLAVEAGAVMVNDVSAGVADLAMADLVADSGVQYVAMHTRGPSIDMQMRAHYADVVKDVMSELQSRVDVLMERGVRDDQLVLDPGLGFAKTAAHNWTLLRGLGELVAWGLPVMVGASRKSFLASVAGPDPTDRDPASAAISCLSARAGVHFVRVHDVAASSQAVRVAQLWAQDVDANSMPAGPWGAPGRVTAPRSGSEHGHLGENR